MAALPMPNLLSESLNIIDPFDFDEGDVPQSLTSSPKSGGLQNTPSLNLSQSLNSSQLDTSTSGLLLQHINTQKEVSHHV